MSVRLNPIFDKTKLDEKEGMSVEDQTVLKIVPSGFLKQDAGHRIAPLPFKPYKPFLENSKQIAHHRTKSFDMNLGWNSERRTHVVDKVAKNSRLVLEAFQSDDLAIKLKDLDLGLADLPIQMSLGLSWDTELDEFTFRVFSDNKPFIRRGVLSTVNTLYDPIGFATPVIIKGKLVMRQMLSSSSTYHWDDPFPESLNQQWELSVPSLSQLEHLPTPRKYNGPSFTSSVK
ncbi:unnamed protein product [Mytilus coruscus]|uniref:Uncharacterized protein n=1 Tax=Mytilus coruscus TaxID=42192 RepID=A0A6J8E3I7_MYTCO|nr:unnamed protein product [Mytilus coruscus]